MSLAGRPEGKTAPQKAEWKQNSDKIIGAFTHASPTYTLRIEDLKGSVGIKRDRLYLHLRELEAEDVVEEGCRGSWRLKPASCYEVNTEELASQDWRRLSSINTNPKSNLCIMRAEVVGGSAEIRTVTPWSALSGAPINFFIYKVGDKPTNVGEGAVELGIPVSELGIEARTAPGTKAFPTRIKRIQLATFNISEYPPMCAKNKKWP